MSDLLREWMPHGQCVQWTPELLVPQVAGDGLTALAYALISLALVAHVRHNWRALWATQGPRIVGLYVWLAGVFGLCGASHVFNVVTVWWGIYQFTALWILATGAISLITVDRLWRSQAESTALWRAPGGAAAVEELRTAARELTEHLREHDERTERP